VFGIFEFCYIDKWWSKKSREKHAISRGLIACVKRWDAGYSLAKTNLKVMFGWGHWVGYKMFTRTGRRH
jgi:hypothetical protein